MKPINPMLRRHPVITALAGAACTLLTMFVFACTNHSTDPGKVGALPPPAEQLPPGRFTPVGEGQNSFGVGETAGYGETGKTGGDRAAGAFQVTTEPKKSETAKIDSNVQLITPDAGLQVKGTTGLSADPAKPEGADQFGDMQKDALNFHLAIRPTDAKPAAPVAPSTTAPAGRPDGGGSGRGDNLLMKRRVPPGSAPNPAPGAAPGSGRSAALNEAAAPEANAAGRRVFVRPPDIAGALPSQHEELWVIAKYCPPDSTRDADGRIVRTERDDDELPGSGALVVTLPNEPRPVPVPLKHTAVKAAVAGNIASVNVTQQYTNPFSSKIEAVYVFPLPENAAVSDFLMKVGDRTIRGVIRDRAEAEQIYADARAQGHVASIMTQERPNIFTQKVANIEPGKQIDIDITYFNTLPYVDGAFEFVFPMVVAPRFNPPANYQGVGAVARGSAPGSSGQQTEVSYLRPKERSGHDIAITVEIDAGVALEGVTCASHVIETRRDPGSTARASVTLSSRDAVPNKDFVLRYAVAGSQMKTGIVTARDKDGNGYFSMLVVPPASVESCRRAPVEMIFVLDCSGSMKGRPIEQAVSAAERALRRLQPDDTFQIINFAQTASQLGPAPLPASDANVKRGVEYVRSLFAEGGTYMINGLRASLDFPHDPSRLRYVCFLTDGLIGNEQEILGEVNARLGASRIFSFGVGTSTNRYLLDAMAKVGRGCVAHLNSGDDSVAIIDRFFDRISRPALTDVQLDLRLGALESVEVFPRVIPDVYVGRPVVINGRFSERSAKGWQGIVVRGRQGGNLAEFTCGVDTARTHPALPAIWARAKIADLGDYATDRNVHLVPGQVRETALRYGLLSSFTAFVAVDSMTKTAGTFGTTVVVPVPVPEGVRYETTVPER